MEELLRRLNEMDTKLEAIYRSTERTRKYFLWTLIATLVFFLLPLVIMLFMVPALISNMNAQLEGLL